MPDTLDHPHLAPPPSATLEPVAAGVMWLRMPLPFRLDHINLWLIEDGDGWTLVDSGLNRPKVVALWRTIADQSFRHRPLRRLIVTHFHPDHIGLAGWLVETFGVPLWISEREWLLARLTWLDRAADRAAARAAFYQRHGVDAETLAGMMSLFGSYARNVAPVPPSYRKIRDGDSIVIGAQGWRVITGAGHAPEHACLYAPATGVLISGDQVLPNITSNVSVWDHEPDANPLAAYLESIARLRDLPADTLVLPAHGLPFRGLHQRIDAIAAHHRDRLDQLLDGLSGPCPAMALVPVLFKRALDPHQMAFAIGETLAHLHYLRAQGMVETSPGGDAIMRFARVR